MRPCNHCGRHFNNKRGLNIHIALMHKNGNNRESFNNNHNNNGNGSEISKEEFDSIKKDVEELKWEIKPYVRIQKRKRQTEEELTESRGNFADCINELKERGLVK